MGDVTIHTDHPFATPEPDKDPVRRLRGRMPSPVTVVATGTGRGRVGLTVSAITVVDGPERRLVAYVDPDSDLGLELGVGARATVSLLHDGDEFLAEVFAGLAPAPGGMFTVGDWIDSDAGPRLADHSWCAVTVEAASVLGWSMQVVATIDEVAVVDRTALAHARGRFHALD